MKRRSLKFNAILSGTQKLLSIIFPLITFPYVSRILQVKMIGKINFSASIISYFVLIAGLGITNYAVREGAKIKNKEKKEIEKFCSEIFSINIISTFLSYLLLFLSYLFWKKLHNYTQIIIIQSFSIIGGTIGINWLFSIYEDYIYITIRTFLFQVVSLVLMFLFVHNVNDYLIYTAITIFANVGSNVINYYYSKKYIKIRFTSRLNLKKHLKPILTIFASTIAITIYVNSDMTILGWLCNDYVVGVYTVSVKVYSIIKQLIASMIIVMLPRTSELFTQKTMERYYLTIVKVFNLLFTITIPAGVGLFIVSSNIIYVISGNDYLAATSSLRILSISLIFAVFSSFVTYSMILPAKNERVQMTATLISAITNIILNIAFIPYFAENAAAATTLLAEIIVFVVEYIGFMRLNETKNLLKLEPKNFLSTIIGCLVIIIIGNFINYLSISPIYRLLAIIVISVVFYFLILLVFKNSVLDFVFEKKKNHTNKLV